MSDEERRERQRQSEAASRRANPEVRRAAVRRSYAKHRDKRRANALASYHKDPLKRSRYLKLHYGISEEDFARLLGQQNDCCYLCCEPLNLEVPSEVHVDHDHSCCRGERSCGVCVLGIACRDCNIGCGYFGDDPARMERVAAARRVAMAEAAQRIAAAPVQSELPLNVVAIKRAEESA